MPRPVSIPFPGLLAVVSFCAFAPTAFAVDESVLRDPRPFDPEVPPAATFLETQTFAPRVLVAGDSWAQYMWDDGAHADILDRFGHADALVVSQSLDADPGPGHTGTEYAISGSEARQWVDTANYPWIANTVAALQANPTVGYVMLSLGGNDLLAGKPDGGWYKDMDLDVAGSEAAVLDQLRVNTLDVIDDILAVRPEIQVVMSSYDYPNFNVGFWCFVYACPKRNELSRDPTNDLITDAELNGFLITSETARVNWTNLEPRVHYDNALGLMHHRYGDGVTGAGLLPKPGTSAPDYSPFPGGNPVRPTLRSNFRVPGLDADPIHLDVEAYRFKAVHQTEAIFFPAFRGPQQLTLQSQGGDRDGWTDGTTTGTGSVRAGYEGSAVSGILSFDTSALPENANVTGARLYLLRSGGSGANPLQTGNLGLPAIDVGAFGAPAVEPGDALAPATATDAGVWVGSGREPGYAVRIELSGAGLSAIDPGGLTQFRLRFPVAGAGTEVVAFADGDGPAVSGGVLPTLGDYMGNTAPFLDLTYEVQVAVGETPVPVPTLLASPNPFSRSTSISYALSETGPVRLDVFDAAGRRVSRLVDTVRPAGLHQATWDGRDGYGRAVPAGLYFARVVTASGARTTRIVRITR